MAMGWLKGLVAPPAFPENAQQQPPGYAGQGGPPVGGEPSPYGVAPAPGTPPGDGPPPGVALYGGGGLPGAMQWSTGTKTQGGAAPVASTPGASAAGGETLEAKCARLQHDVEALALFARTLLTLLEEKQLVTREQFDTTKQRLDLLDGKLDDR